MRREHARSPRRHQSRLIKRQGRVVGSERQRSVRRQVDGIEASIIADHREINRPTGQAANQG